MSTSDEHVHPRPQQARSAASEAGWDRGAGSGRPQPLMTLDEVVAYVGVSKRWAYEQARTGALPCMLIARNYRFRVDDVDAWVDGFRVSPASEFA